MFNLIRLQADLRIDGYTYPADTYGHVHEDRGTKLLVALPEGDDGPYTQMHELRRDQVTDTGFTPDID